MEGLSCLISGYQFGTEKLGMKTKFSFFYINKNIYMTISM